MWDAGSRERERVCVCEGARLLGTKLHNRRKGDRENDETQLALKEIPLETPVSVKMETP